MVSINSHIKDNYIKFLEYTQYVRKRIPDGIFIDMIAIFVFFIILFQYNKMLAGYTILLYLYGVWIYCAKDGKNKLVLLGIYLILFALILSFFFNHNIKIQMILKEIFKKGRWSTWLSCITVNSFVLSRFCNKKILIERASCTIGYIMVMFMGMMCTIVIECYYIKSNQNDNSTIINIICLIFMIAYSVIQPIIPSIDELIIMLEWKYDVKWEEQIIELRKYKGNRKKINIKLQYNINGELLNTHVDIGAFSNCESIEEIEMSDGVGFDEQYLSILLGENRNIKRIRGLNRSVKYDAVTKKYCPNLNSIEWN